MLWGHMSAVDKKGAGKILARTLWGDEARWLGDGWKMLSHYFGVLDLDQGPQTLFKHFRVFFLSHQVFKLILRPKISLLKHLRKLSLVPDAIRAPTIIKTLILVLIHRLIMQHLLDQRHQHLSALVLLACILLHLRKDL